MSSLRKKRRAPRYIKRGGRTYYHQRNDSYRSSDGYLLDTLILNAILNGDSHDCTVSSDHSSFDSSLGFSGGGGGDFDGGGGSSSYGGSDSGGYSGGGDSGGGDSGGGGDGGGGGGE